MKCGKATGNEVVRVCENGWTDNMLHYKKRNAYFENAVILQANNVAADILLLSFIHCKKILD